MIGPGLPHDRPPLSKRSLLTGRVPLLADAAQLAERGIEHLDGIVTGCDLDRRRLRRALLPRRRAARDRSAEPRLGDRPALPEATAPRASTRPRRTPRAPASIPHAAPRPPGQASRRRRRRPDRHRDGRDARRYARRDARRHARPPARPLAPACVRRRPRDARATRRALPRLVRDRVARASSGGAAVLHTSTHGDLGCDVVVSAAGFRSSLPPELAGDGRATLTARGRRAAACARSRTASGPAATASRSRTLAGAGSRSRTGTTRSGAAGTSPSRSSARRCLTSASLTSSATSATSASSRSGSPTRSPNGTATTDFAVGLRPGGAPACVLLLNAPARLREARELVASGRPHLTVPTHA